jgi:hypothetical protein
MMSKKTTLLLIGLLIWSEYGAAQKFSGGSFDGGNAAQSGVITTNGVATTYAYANIKFFGGSFDGGNAAQSGVITTNGVATTYAYANIKFFGGSFDGGNAAQSGVITTSGADTLYAYLNPRFFGGSRDGASKAATDSVFTLDVEEEKPSARLPKEYGLSQNYPNPFNPTTVIRYQLSATSKVNLSLYDMLGRRVAVLVNTRQGAGVYDVRLSATAYNLSSGIYFYRLQADGQGEKKEQFVETRKMALVK